MGGFRGQVRCDCCNGRFRPSLIEEATASGGERLYYGCPFCGERYHVAEVTAKGLAARRALVAIRGRIKGLRSKPDTQETRDEVRGLREEFAAYRAMLEQEMVEPGG